MSIFNIKYLEERSNDEIRDFVVDGISFLGGTQTFGYSSDKEAFAELDDIFATREDFFQTKVDFTKKGDNTLHVKNKQFLLHPSNNPVEDFKKAINELKNIIWLHDIDELKLIRKNLAITNDKKKNISENFKASKSLRDKFIKHLKENDYEINYSNDHEVSITGTGTKKKKVSYVIPFSFIPLVGKIGGYLSDLFRYSQYAENLCNPLLQHFNLKNITGKDKKTEIAAKFKENIQDQTLQKIVKNEVKTKGNLDLFFKIFDKTDKESIGISKSIFRDDILKSISLNILELEHEKCGHIDLIVSFFSENKFNIEEANSTKNHLLGKARNMIFFGAPGTGKSYFAGSYITCLQQHKHRTVFFSDYQYSDFVGTIKPCVKQTENGSDMSYQFEQGPLTQALVDALKHPNQEVVLIIEEMNRGNATAIFGDFFQLLDRDSTGESKYEISWPESLKIFVEQQLGEVVRNKCYLPKNFYIIATMNNSDQNVFPLDTAFKRRFNFKYVPIEFKNLDKSKKIFIDKSHNASWPQFAQAINRILTENIEVAEDRLLGPYFLSPEEQEAQSLNDIIREKVLIYIWEDVLRHNDKNCIFREKFKTFSSVQNAHKNEEQVFSELFVQTLLKST